MFGLRTSRFYEKRNNYQIALNLFQGDINDFNELEESEDILTKRGKVKNKSKIEYFKNYINNFKEIKFKTARPIEIFRKKEEKKEKNIIKENIKEIKENIPKYKNNNNNQFNVIKENFQKEEGNQIDNINNNKLNPRNELDKIKAFKAKKKKKEISNKINQNNEDKLNKLKKNKNIKKILENEKEKIQKKILKLKESEKRNNISTEKAIEFLDKDNEKFIKLIKGKKMQKITKKKLNKSFNKSFNKDIYFNENKLQNSLAKTVSNENIQRKVKKIQNKYHMKIINSKDKYIHDKIEKEIFNRKRKNFIKASKYLSKSCSNKTDKSKNILENKGKEIEKIYKNQKQNIEKIK